MGTMMLYTNERKRALLRFVSIVKGRKITSFNEAECDVPETLKIANKLTALELVFLANEIKQRIGG